MADHVELRKFLVDLATSPKTQQEVAGIQSKEELRDYLAKAKGLSSESADLIANAQSSTEGTQTLVDSLATSAWKTITHAHEDASW